MTISRQDHITKGRRSFTLIELLAVIVLLSLAAGIGAGHLSNATESANQRAVLASVLDLDARARLLARRSGPVCLVLTEELDTQTAMLTGGAETDFPGWRDDQAPIARVTISPPLQLELLHESGQVLENIDFDALGRSIDYRIVLSSPTGQSEHRVLGLTGRVVEEASP